MAAIDTADISTQARQSGRVKWFSDAKGYGFIELENGMDAFVHYSEIQMEGFRVLRDQQQVEYRLVETGKGFQAREVTLI